MGEISEALRRAREGSRREGPVAAPTPARREPVAAFAAPPRDASAAVEISSTAEGAWSARAVLIEAQNEIAEGYRHFAIRLQRLMQERAARSVLITSAARGEGKTTTACNLALALASVSAGRRIALLDLDVRRPSAAQQLGVTPAQGIERVLAGKAALGDACIHTQLSELDLYLVRGPSENPLAALSGPLASQLIRDLARSYDTVVIDCPPVLPVPDVPILLPHVDAVLLVARNGHSRRAALRETMESLGGDKVLGLFLNEGKTPRHRRYGGYYGYTPDKPVGEVPES